MAAQQQKIRPAPEGNDNEETTGQQIDVVYQYKQFKKALKATRRGFKYLAGSAVVSVCAFGVAYILELLR